MIVGANMNIERGGATIGLLATAETERPAEGQPWRFRSLLLTRRADGSSFIAPLTLAERAELEALLAEDGRARRRA